MDLRSYYQNLRDVEANIAEAFPVVVSAATPEGGKEGTLTETPRWLAARMIAQGQARLATEEQTQAYRSAHAEARRKAEQEATAARVQIAVLTPAELSRIKGKDKSVED
jgi:hypothetical protein